MTIELITGTPGSGKTTFAVATRLTAEVGRKITLETGEVIERRLCVGGVRGLLVEHERLPHTLTGEKMPQGEIDKWNELDSADEPLHKRLPGEPPREDVPASLFNWWLWCKPGDLIVVDEIQFIVPRGTLGRKPPLFIALLEVHRHYGVDFLIITQHPQLLDNTIRALVGLHRHVRSVMGSAVCMVYVWDHASNPERYTNANKSTFVRRAKHYRLFKSSVAHVKPPTSGRSVLLIVPVLLIVCGFLFTKTKERFTSGQTQPVAAQIASKPPSPVVPTKSAASAPQAMLSPGSRIAGCFAVRDRCECQDGDGRRVVVELAMCKASSQSYDGLVKWERRVEPALPAASKPAQTSS